MRVAIVHDYLTQRGGAERVVLAIARAFPDAPIHTSLFLPGGTFPAFADLDVRPMAVDRIPGLRRRHRLALPLLAPAFSATRIDADLVICSSSGWAHGVRTTGRKIVYCHNPARWLYQRDQYAAAGPKAVVATVLGAPLRAWDRHAARSADRYVANASVVQERIRATYGIDADLLPPPAGIDPAGAQRPLEGCAPGFVLCVSRLMAYKNVDAVVAAFGEMPSVRLVVVGEGPERPRLERTASPNVRFAGRVDDAGLRWLYANSRALVAASYEDFGLTPLEAASFGRPTAALHWGGFLDTIADGRTGVFFDRPDAASVAEGVRTVLSREWDEGAITDHAATYSEAGFVDRLRAFVEETASPMTCPRGPHAPATPAERP